MPARTWRPGIRGRPPRTREGGGGSKGWITAHSSSGTIAAMLPDLRNQGSSQASRAAVQQALIRQLEQLRRVAEDSVGVAPTG
jgi:hypothetical protein